ncbi:MAG: tetratricopeptide repeat protein [Comamonas sp.]|nr:tetratricopeptide repeat protein [Comamonas sp.]
MSFASVLSLLHARNTFTRHVRLATTSGLICVAAVSGGVAWAAPSAVEEVTQLLDQGKAQEAARRAQGHLKQNANDVQMRFLQGVIAAELKNYSQAIDIFTALTQGYPSLPEPYNNLAVLHAAKGDERKAAQVLEQAIRTNPSYATAHENLGDLYARMASDAYAKALQLDGSRQAIQPKLLLIKQIFPGQTAVAASSTTVAVTQSPEPVAKPAAKAVAVEPAPRTTPAVVAEAPAVQAKTEPAQPESANEKKPLAVSLQIEQAVQRWAEAWASQDMKAYYATYSERFQPASGETLSQWKTERKNRIISKNTITVAVRELKVAVQGNAATASFRQHYAAGSYKATTRKTLHLQREGGQWLITREDTGA